MLNIFKQKNKDTINTLNSKPKVVSINRQSNYLGYVRHFPPATKEWCNSIYAYNKNTTKSLPVYGNIIINLIKSYFNLYNADLEKKIYKRSNRLRVKLTRRSTNRIFVSKAELKHTNTRAIITIYTYNEQERYLLNKLEKIDPIVGIKKRRFLKKIRYIKLQGLNIINQVNTEKGLLCNKQLINKFKYYETRLYKDFTTKFLKKEMLNFIYLRLISFNKRKFENTYLLPLNKLIKKIYDKKIEFNLIDLKYFYLNSDIFSQAIAIKIKNNKNKLLKVLKASLSIVKLPYLNKLSDRYSSEKLYITSLTGKLENFDALSLVSFKDTSKNNNDVLHQLLQVFKNKNDYSNYIETAVLNSIRNKTINGVRFETSGRLSKRFTASRSVFKIKYKGSLKNIDSSYKGLSSVMLRGHARSNIEYTNVNSKTRNGSFGLKGWISSE